MGNKVRDNAWFFGFLAGIGALLLISMSIAFKKDTNWWAAWGQWVGGLGSIIAAGVAVWIAVVGWRKSDQQAREQAQRSEEAQEREVASRFGVWIGIAGANEMHLGDHFPYPGIPVIKYHNATHQAAHAIVVEVDFRIGDRTWMDSLLTAGPTTKPQLFGSNATRFSQVLKEIVKDEHEALAARAAEALSQTPTPTDLGLSEENIPSTILLSRTRVSVTFTDGSGNRWTRNHDGKLEKH
jgi:hypothetical protein